MPLPLLAPAAATLPVDSPFAALLSGGLAPQGVTIPGGATDPFEELLKQMLQGLAPNAAGLPPPDPINPTLPVAPRTSSASADSPAGAIHVSQAPVSGGTDLPLPQL